MADAENPFHTTPDVFHKLQLILPKVVKNDGELIPQEIWHGEDRENETTLKQATEISDRTASISFARSRLKQAEDLLDAFSFLRSSLQKRVASFRARMPQWTITDLPNELLLLIFDYAEPDLRHLRRLLQVSKRFRRLVFSSPRLWAQQALTLHSSPYDIDAVAERSGVFGFRAYIGYESEGTVDPKHAIFRHCKSWTRLGLHGLSSSELQHVLARVPCTSLITLKELTILRKFNGGRVLQFSKDWSPPSLTTLRCIDCVPRLLRASALCECSLTFSYTFPLGTFTAFLSSSTSIERLSIALLSVHSYDYTDTEFVATAKLPNLKSLAVRLINVDEFIIANTFLSILSPNITSFLAIVGKSGDDPDPNRGLRVLTKELNVRYPLLKKVGLGAVSRQFEELTVSYFEHDVNETLEDLPKGVEDLVLLIRNQDCDIHVPSSAAVDTLEGLRSFGLLHCNYISENFFDQLPILLKSYGITLDTIHIESCKICDFHDTDFEDFMRMNDVKGSLIREGVTKKVAESGSGMMEEFQASLEEFLGFDWY